VPSMGVLLFDCNIDSCESKTNFVSLKLEGAYCYPIYEDGDVNY
jgi:hypothetical protein